MFNVLRLFSAEGKPIFYRIVNNLGSDTLSPLTTSVIAPPMEAIDLYTTLTSSNSEVKVHWTPNTFRGQVIDTIRVNTDPNDGICGQLVDPYCEINVVSTSLSGEYTLTGLIPGRSKLLLVLFFSLYIIIIRCLICFAFGRLTGTYASLLFLERGTKKFPKEYTMHSTLFRYSLVSV